MKALFITEKPSVAREFAAALNINAKNRDGYMEGDKAVITWCVGHLVTMSYPDQYDPALLENGFCHYPDFVEAGLF